MVQKSQKSPPNQIRLLILTPYDIGIGRGVTRCPLVYTGRFAFYSYITYAEFYEAISNPYGHLICPNTGEKAQIDWEHLLINHK